MAYASTDIPRFLQSAGVSRIVSLAVDAGLFIKFSSDMALVMPETFMAWLSHKQQLK